MTRLSLQAPIHPLGRAEGRAIVSGPQVILKGALESDREISLIAAPRHEAFMPFFAAANDESAAPILRQHGMSVIATAHATRAITLAAHSANSGRAAVALVPNAQLEACAAVIASAASTPLHSSGSLCILIEDHPRIAPGTCPRQAAMRLNIPCVEPADLAELRDLLDYALRLSRVGATPVAMIVHSHILRSAQSLEARPNRISSTVDLVLARRRRKPRWAETATGRDLMRLARRMELNRARAMPNPGERVPVGFITVGPTDAAVAHLAEALDLHGRLPVLQLALLHPIDESAISRLLARCERVVVLEPRPSPGAVEHAVLKVAEDMRHRGGASDRPATVWGRTLPTDAEGASPRLEIDESLHPSTLARKAIHLLHLIRPTMHVAQRLAPEPPPVPHASLTTSKRGLDIGVAGALATLRRVAADVDQWLRGQTAQLKERGIEPSALAIDGIDPPLSAGVTRIVPVEFFSGRAFQETGIAATRQATRSDRPWILFICDFDAADNQDIERLVRGVIPGERAERATITLINLNDRPAIRSHLEEAALENRLSVLIARDGPPPKYDISAIERAMAGIDRFGFQPRQRLIWPADLACMLTPPPDEEEESPLDANMDKEAVRTEVVVDRFTSSKRGRVRLKVQPLLEQIDVIRTKPPAWVWRSALAGHGAPVRLELPAPIHRRQPEWRAHIAGFRGASPGVAAHVLQEAGHNMGYDVASIHDPTPIGPGRRAWTQLLFTRSRAPESATATGASRNPLAHEARPAPARRLVAGAPYGEADLLLGFDAQETLRAIGPSESLRVAERSRTSVVANNGAFTGEEDRGFSPAVLGAFCGALAAVGRDEHCVIEDFAAVTRAWFYTDRVADLAMLGVAFQRGLIPVNLEAMEAALARAEERGFGRSIEAFTFGRHLAVSPRFFTKPREERDDDLATMVRRLALGLRAGRVSGASVAARFEGLVQRSLAAMPGLSETVHGRSAQRDFVNAIYRAIEWGGFDYATRYADAITSLYQIDRGETGRSLTRSAVLPLADAMLIHDAIYIATMATNPEQRRRLRQRLNVKHARGDEIERRYLTRFELSMFNRRFRADVRTSDWPARFARMLRHMTPSRWRGTRRERDLRSHVEEFVKRAAFAAKDDYERWNDAMHRLHLQAAENRLRGMALAELRMLADAGDP